MHRAPLNLRKAAPASLRRRRFEKTRNDLQPFKKNRSQMHGEDIRHAVQTTQVHAEHTAD
jgi:hypothetical protein